MDRKELKDNLHRLTRAHGSLGKYEQDERIEAVLAEFDALREERDARRKALAQEIAIGLEKRGFWRPKDPASSDLILAVFKAIDALRAEIKAPAPGEEK